MEKKHTLPREFGEKWVQALRGGEYKQTKNKLAKVENGKCSYCCLGVAGKMRHFTDAEMCQYGELSELSSDNDYKDLKEIYGIPERLILGMLVSELIGLNDTENYTFPQIADWIEQNVELI